MSKIEETSIRKLVQALHAAAFRQGELEHRESVSNATLTKNSETVEAAKNAIIAEVESLKADVAKLNTAWQSAIDQAMENGSKLNAERAKVVKLREALNTSTYMLLGWLNADQLDFRPLPDVKTAREQVTELRTLLTEDKPCQST